MAPAPYPCPCPPPHPDESVSQFCGTVLEMSLDFVVDLVNVATTSSTVDIDVAIALELMVPLLVRSSSGRS